MSFYTDAKLRETRPIWLSIGLASGIALSGVYGLVLASTMRAGQVELASSIRAGQSELAASVNKITATIKPMAESFDMAIEMQLKGKAKKDIVNK